MTASRTGPSGADPDRRASCPWCRRRFVTIVALFDHIDRRHLVPDPAAT